MLDLLMDGKWHSHMDLGRVGGVRYSARLLELKRIGWKIESKTLAAGEDGKAYRLESTTKGPPLDKKVKVFLTEEDAVRLVAGVLTPSACSALRDAIGSFQANKHKL